MSVSGGSVRHSWGRPRMCISTAPHFSSASVFLILRVPEKSADVVDDLCSRFHGGTRHAGLVGID